MKELNFRVYFEALAPSHSNPVPTARTIAQTEDALAEFAADIDSLINRMQIEATMSITRLPKPELKIKIPASRRSEEIQNFITSKLREYELLAEKLC